MGKGDLSVCILVPRAEPVMVPVNASTVFSDFHIY